MGEGDQGLQERSLPLAEGVGREGGQLAPPGSWCPAHHAEQGAGRLHWREADRTVQGRHLPLLRWQHDVARVFAPMVSMFFFTVSPFRVLFVTAVCCPTDFW